MLDPADQLAVPAAREGDPLPVYIEETEKNFAIGWTGTYRIDSKAFVYSETESGRVRAILGYPIRLIIEQTGCQNFKYFWLELRSDGMRLRGCLTIGRSVNGAAAARFVPIVEHMGLYDEASVDEVAIEL